MTRRMLFGLPVISLPAVTVPAIASAAAAATRIRLSQIDPLPSTITPRSIREIVPATGDTFRVLGHMTGWDLQVFVSRGGGPAGLATPNVDYELTLLSTPATPGNPIADYQIKLIAPISTGDHIQWVKWIL